VSVAIAIALPWLAVLWVDRARLQIAMLAGIAALAVGWIVLADDLRVGAAWVYLS